MAMTRITMHENIIIHLTFHGLASLKWAKDISFIELNTFPRAKKIQLQALLHSEKDNYIPYALRNHAGIQSKLFWCACISNLVSGCHVLLYELVQQQHQVFSEARPIFRQLGEIK